MAHSARSGRQPVAAAHFARLMALQTRPVAPPSAAPQAIFPLTLRA